MISFAFDHNATNRLAFVWDPHVQTQPISAQEISHLFDRNPRSIHPGPETGLPEDRLTSASYLLLLLLNALLFLLFFDKEIRILLYESMNHRNFIQIQMLSRKKH